MPRNSGPVIIHYAAIAQLVERYPCKVNVVGFDSYLRQKGVPGFAHLTKKVASALWGMSDIEVRYAVDRSITGGEQHAAPVGSSPTPSQRESAVVPPYEHP